MIEFLERVVPSPPDRPQIGGPDHPMRKVTRQVAFESNGWTPERAEKVATLFDAMAPDWHSRQSSERQEALRDALKRGNVPGGPHAVCAEIGSGTGSSTPDLAKHFGRVVAIDLSREMLRRAPAEPGLRARADGACLPLG